LISTAYSAFNQRGGLSDRRETVLGGPNWLDSDRYDISAKAARASSVAEMYGPMLQALLEDRCALAVHKETRERSVYALTVSRRPVHLTPAPEGSCIAMDLDKLARAEPRPVPGTPRVCGTGGEQVRGALITADWFGTTMEEFASRMVSSYVDRPVIDRTGLTERFNVHLEFSFDSADPTARSRSAGVGEKSAESDDPAATLLSTALEQQLGLRLVTAKGPEEVILIDRITRPSAN